MLFHCQEPVRYLRYHIKDDGSRKLGWRFCEDHSKLLSTGDQFHIAKLEDVPVVKDEYTCSSKYTEDGKHWSKHTGMDETIQCADRATWKYVFDLDDERFGFNYYSCDAHREEWLERTAKGKLWGNVIFRNDERME
jgi:hypothetical protein